jgi:TP901 family phage tail tape measure protein
MPFGTRDVLLVIRARDQASRIVRDVGRSFGGITTASQQAGISMMAMGGALMGLGTMIAGVGLKGLSVAKGWINTSMEFNKQAALTLTQVDQTGVKLEDIKKISKDVANAIPVPFESLQSALFDIFSSMNVNLTGAKTILEAFSKGAVAGGVDVQTAGRATIAILNAWGLSASDVGHVMDVQFQLVRKGVGTYDEFAKSIGKAIPSARRAGQSVESLSAVLAFLTRNGLSTAMAATSAARAFDNLANPKVQANLKKMNITLVDGKGKFKQMSDIVQELGLKMKGLTDPERAKALDAIFKGAGNNIQARRFWDLAIRNFDQLSQRQKEMINSSGAMQNAYDIMFNQPVSQVQLLKNNLTSLKTELGDALAPAFNKIVGKITEWVHWLNNLSPKTKDMIAKAFAFTSALLAASGALIALRGSFMLIHGAFKVFGGLKTIISLFATFGWWILVIAAAALLIYANWDRIKAWWKNFWPEFKQVAQKALQWIEDKWKEIWPVLYRTARQVWDWIAKEWKALWPGIKSTFMTVWEWLKAEWTTYWPILRDTAVTVFKTLRSAWETMWPIIKRVVEAVFNWIDEHWPQIVEAFKTGWKWISDAWVSVKGFVDEAWQKIKVFAAWVTDTFWPGLKKVFLAIKQDAGPIFFGIVTIVSKIVHWIVEYMQWLWPKIKWVLDKIWAYWKFIWPTLSRVIKIVWDWIATIIADAIHLLRGIIDFLVGIFTLNWSKVWKGIKEIFGAVFDAILATLTGALGLIWEALKLAGKAIVWAIGELWDGIVWAGKKVWDFFTSIPEIINGLIKGALTWLWNTGVDIITGMISGLWQGIKALGSFFLDLPGNILEFLKDAYNWLTSTGVDILAGMVSGLWQGLQKVYHWFLDLPGDILHWMWDAATWLYDIGKRIIEGLWHGMKDFWKDHVKGWLEDAKNIIISVFKQGLHIQSPSKVMATIGSQTIQGLQVGMKKALPLLKKQLNVTSNLIAQPMPAATSTAALPVGVGGANTNTSQVNYTVAPGAVQITFGSSVKASDADTITQVVNDAFKKLFTQLDQASYNPVMP